MSAFRVVRSEDFPGETLPRTNPATEGAGVLTTLNSAKVINPYLSWLMSRHCAPTTLRTARWVLHHVAHAIGKSLLDATPDDLDRWMALRAREVNSATLRNQATYVKSYYRWAVQHDFLELDPTRRLALPRATRRRPRPIPEDRLAAALDAADPMMLAILCLAALAGLRACEIAGLDWSEVTLAGEQPEMRIVGKGGHEDVVEVSPELAEVLAALPGLRRGPVIRRLDGMPGHVHPTRISQMANRFLREQGIPDNLHSLRHRFVTAVYRATKDLRVSQEAARHAAPSTTALYAGVARSGVREAICAAGAVGLARAPDGRVKLVRKPASAGGRR